MSEFIKILPDFEERLDCCRSRLVLGKIQPNCGLSLQVDKYDLSKQDFSDLDAQSPTFENLIRSYGEQLLFPLFQQSQPYSRLNQIAANKPRYDEMAAREEVMRFLGIKSKPCDRIFTLLTSPDCPERFSQLIGYTIGYGLTTDDLITLFQRKFTPGAIGTKSSDTFEIEIDTEELQSIAPCIYFDGIGVVKSYQGNYLGLFLTLELFKKAEQFGYSRVLTRVVRGAGNWTIFAGDDNVPQKPLGNTEYIAKYFNPAFNSETFYRAIFISDVNQMNRDLELLLKLKVGLTEEPCGVETRP